MTTIIAVFIAKFLDIWAIPAFLLGWKIKNYWYAPIIGAIGVLWGELLLKGMHDNYQFNPAVALIGLVAISLWYVVGAAVGRWRASRVSIPTK